jgi:hypothetical protein
VGTSLLLIATTFFGTFFSTQAKIQSATWRLFKSIIIMWGVAAHAFAAERFVQFH